jgi:hypothetical protein
MRPGMISAVNAHRFRWINYAACLWALLFAAPHVWWALGFSAGFPGGRANHHLMMTTWRYFFDVVVILLSIIAILVALALIGIWGRTIPRWILRTMAWIASAMLTSRGVAGLVVDGASDPVWWPTFLLGGILFASVAWLARPPKQTTNLQPGDLS